ncbi:hypothetical protein BC936DRAFT_146937 [Jimgerdemannia flammicorona]|uniref:Uncharacterized protein n=1 Tax=Jimgerdemannia flammicorona TaxID=994334 RepID=A0A433D6G3_9FUNG|nr:hypothetical protein BC936DRAFT_146937 [Jimgerdemannia flammicorona]
MPTSRRCSRCLISASSRRTTPYTKTRGGLSCRRRTHTSSRARTGLAWAGHTRCISDFGVVFVWTGLVKPSSSDKIFAEFNAHLPHVGRTREGVANVANDADCVRLDTVLTGPFAQILTSQSDEEILDALKIIVENTDGTGLMHEAFNVFDNTGLLKGFLFWITRHGCRSGVSFERDYTRPWFAWSNTLLGEAILEIAKERPYLIFEKKLAP